VRIAVTGGSGSVGKHVLRMAGSLKGIPCARSIVPGGTTRRQLCLDGVDYVPAELSDYRCILQMQSTATMC
jgi:nucleoside-diphosphate-sugar epimerase